MKTWFASLWFRLLRYRFWHRALGGRQTWFTNRLDCLFAGHRWADVHSARDPAHWVVSHRTCSRCGVRRRPPKRK